MWDVGDVGCSGDGDVGCSRCGMFGMWDVWDVGCSGYGTFRIWDVWDVGCSGCGIRDVDLQNALSYVKNALLHYFTVL